MTQLLYLSDTYLYSGSARILDISENEYGKYIVLDQTLFYPQWWGQPSDKGKICSQLGIFLVEKVRIDEEGRVLHYGSYEEWVLEEGSTIMMEIDHEYRIINARTHSAWHLLDIALENIWLPWMATKWYHFSDGPYVEYSGKLSESIEWIQEKLQKELDTLIQKNISLLITYDTQVKSPSGKTPRYVAFEGYEWCGCGGTHVKNSGEIGKVEIRKIKMKDGAIRVSYTLV